MIDVNDILHEPLPYEEAIEIVRASMADQPEAIQIEYRIDLVIRELDELCGLAKDGKVDEYAAGQILTRAQLIASFLQARKEPKFKVVSNNG